MQTAQLLRRNLIYFWRTNLAVVAGVASAVAVLAGALLVGDSVRASLRDLLLSRLGHTDHLIAASNFFRDQLAEDLQSDGAFASRGLSGSCPLIELEGSVTEERNRTRASHVRVYGVDERFWRFHGRYDQRAPENREVLVSESLARELNSKPGDSILVQIEMPSEVPIESLYGNKENLGRTLRLTIRETLSASQLGDFLTRPQQTEVHAVFISLQLLQRELNQQGKVNTLLVSRSKDSAGLSDAERTAALKALLKERVGLEDYGIKLRALDQGGISVERAGTLLDDDLAESANKVAAGLSARTVPVFSYVVNSLTLGERTVPYSLVSAIDAAAFAEFRHDSHDTASLPPIIINEWTAHQLEAKPGNQINLDYFVWQEDGHLETRTAKFHVVAVVPIQGLAADKNLVPDYPGISESQSLSDWDPPFPVDLQRIRPQDEDYWHKYRTTAKAFIPLAVGQQLWQSRFGKLTSLRLTPPDNTSVPETLAAYERQLKSSLDPSRMGLVVIPAREQGLEASRGATDFGEYFLYFSFFLVVSALLLTSLFFKLGIEQRLREIGVLQTVGFPPSRVRKIFLLEGIALSVLGSLLGLIGAIAYGYLMMTGLSSWWVGAVGTTMLKLHVDPSSLLLGAFGGVTAASLCIVWTLRRIGSGSTRSLLTGTLTEATRRHGDAETRRRGDRRTRRHGDAETRRREDPETGRRRDAETERHADHRRSPRLRVPVSPRLLIAFVLTVLGVALLLLASFQVIGQTAGFFGGGVLLLAALLCYQAVWLRGNRRQAIQGTGWWPVSRLGFRNATYRPGRSVLCIALIASAAFIIVSVDAFRRRAGATVLDRKSGNGGYPLLAESLLPIVHDPNTREGRQALNLSTDENLANTSNVVFTRFRVRPGDDASCLNLYQPRNPKIIAPRDDFLRSNRFTFQNSLAESSAEKENPWLLLNREFSDGAVPVIADANSMTYVLHLKLGEDLLLNRKDGAVRLRVVGSLADSVFQSELLMSERNFVHLFPEEEGYRFFLIDTPASERLPEIAATLEDRLSDLGFDVASTNERLASFHRVENTYLSTFQMLGGLGLILGTLGLAAVLLRNVLERRRELALLRAVGYDSSHFALMVIAENAFLLFCGLSTGAICALLAIAPVFFGRGGQLPNISLGFLLLGVLISGLIASLVATWAALRSPLLPALRAE